MALTERLTLDEFLLLPEEKPALEYERGVITQKMAPMGWHAKLQGMLFNRFEMHGLSAYCEARVAWPIEGIAYVPDVIAYLIEHEGVDANGFVANQILLPPDIAVEIWSAGQTLGSQTDRCRWYVEHGVQVALLFHPERQVIWTVRLGANARLLQDQDIVDLSDLVPGLTFTVAEVFAGLRSRRARAAGSD